MERLVLDRAELEGRPALAAQHVPRDRLEVALVGVFENDNAPWSSDAAELDKHWPRIVEVMEHPDAHGRVEVAVGIGQLAGVAEQNLDAGVARKSFARRRYMDFGRIEQDDFAVTSVLVGQAAETRPDLDQTVASRRKQGSNRDPVAGVFVPAGGPEDVAVAQVLVRGEGAFRRMRLEAAGLCQEGLAAPTARR